MRHVDEDKDQSAGLEQRRGKSDTGPGILQQFRQLRTRSQDLTADGDSASDNDSPPGGGDTSAAMGAGADPADTSAREQPLSSDSEAEAEAPPSGLATQHFCCKHGIDPASLPAPPPAADSGVSFETLLAGTVTPVCAYELQVVRNATIMNADDGEKFIALALRNLALCGRLTRAGEPEQWGDDRAIQLDIQDAQGQAVSFLVLDPAFEALTPAAFVAEAVARFPAGTAVAIIDFTLIIEPVDHDHYCVVRRGTAEVEGAPPPGVVHRLGTASLPSLKLSQVDRVSGILLNAGQRAIMVNHTVDSMKDAAEEVDVMLRPLLVSLAVAHLRLGAVGVALAYATAASQIVFQMTPPAAACASAEVLNKFGLKTGAWSALHLGEFPQGHELASLKLEALFGLLEIAGVDAVQYKTDTAASLAKIADAHKSGTAQIAEGLARTEKEWLEHALGDVSAVQAAAERAAADHGPNAGQHLKLEADRLFAAGSSKEEPVKNRQNVEDAILKWRAALRLIMDPEGQEGKTGGYAWTILKRRYLHWEECSRNVDPRAIRYMDVAALAVLHMRRRDIGVSALRMRSIVHTSRAGLKDGDGVTG